MKEEWGDIWEHHARGSWIVVTTNGSLNRHGHAVMGRGIALQAAQRFPSIRARLGAEIKRMVAASALRDSLPCVAFEDIRIICYPVKWEWHEDADMDLIVDSARHMMDIIKDIGITHIYSVKPGCGNGGLRWGQVQAKLAGIFDNRVTIVDVPENRAKR